MDRDLTLPHGAVCAIAKSTGIPYQTVWRHLTGGGIKSDEHKRQIDKAAEKLRKGGRR